MSEQSPEPPAAPEPRPSGRGRATAADMVRSLAVVLAIVGVLVAFNAVQQPDPVLRELEYPAALDTAQQQVDYDLAGPAVLPAGWNVTSARVRTLKGGVTWHLGMVTARQAYAAVEQSDGARRDLVELIADGARSTGQVRVGGRTWERLEGGEPQPRALVRVDAGVTTMVAGGAGWAELRRLAGALR